MMDTTDQLSEENRAIARAEFEAALVGRWARTLERAQESGIHALRLPMPDMYAVSSSKNDGTAYLTDRVTCTCLAGQHRDPVCMHRALVRAIQERP